MKIIMENVRCFARRHEVELAPLTLLIGENSSGKTTFLAATSIVRSSDYPMRTQFNAAPFSLGNYDSIASYKGGKFGRAETIVLGYERATSEDPQGATKVEATFRKSTTGEPVLSKLGVVYGDRSLTIYFTGHNAASGSSLTLKVGTKSTSYDVPEPPDGPAVAGHAPTHYELFRILQTVKLDDRDRRALETLVLPLRSNSAVTSIAPIRTRPERTWDEPTTEFSPEGKHIPYMLESKLADPAFKEALEEFGAESGLFSRLEVRRWGGQPGNPLQLMVTGTGRPANLVDVGYGVSQALPVVVQCIQAARNQMILLQQPEVHLHPRAQAALGTLFAKTAPKRKMTMIVETHSDYIVDRIRQHVAKGDIRPADVRILYFEKCKADAAIYPITLDEGGNVVDAPPGYRSFFMEERMNLLTRGLAR
jgi:hypothetical protein